MKKILKRLKNVKYKKEKIRFISFSIGLILVLFLSSFLFTVAYSRYESRTRIFANIDKALYIFGTDNIKFNLEPTGIIPRDEPYIYNFSVSNYNTKTNKESDVDMEYSISLVTTTNLPIEISIYRNEDYKKSVATEIFESYDLKQDVDNAWYKCYGPSDWYGMEYTKKVTDVYTIVIYFPEVYREDITYADYIESIEVELESRQVI